MSWNPNGQQQQRKIPDPGKGRLRKTREIKRRPDGTQLSPDFNGLINHEGQILSLSIWFEAAKAGGNGQMMPESFSARVSRYDPNAQGQQAPQQQQMPMQYPPQQPPVYAQQAPGPAYAPSPQPPQHGGYAPAPGYQPPPPAGAPPQAPQWGGQPQQGRPPQAQAGGYQKSEIPF